MRNPEEVHLNTDHVPTWRKDQLHGVIIIFQVLLCWELSGHLPILPFLVIRVTAPREEKQCPFYMGRVATAIQTYHTEEPVYSYSNPQPLSCFTYTGLRVLPRNTFSWTAAEDKNHPSSKFYNPVQFCCCALNRYLFIVKSHHQTPSWCYANLERWQNSYTK